MTKPGEGHFTHNTRSVGVSHLLKEGHTVCITPSKSYLYRSTQQLEQQICVELQKQPSLLESILVNPHGFFHSSLDVSENSNQWDPPPAAALQFNNLDLQLPLHSTERSEHDQVAEQEQQHTTHTEHLRAAHHPSQVGVHVDRPKLRLLGTDKVKGSAHCYFIVPERGDTWC